MTKSFADEPELFFSFYGYLGQPVLRQYFCILLGTNKVVVVVMDALVRVELSTARQGITLLKPDSPL